MRDGGHLWTINSHEEWTNIYTRELHDEWDVSNNVFDPKFSQYSFIGMKNRKVMFSETHKQSLQLLGLWSRVIILFISINYYECP